MTPACAPHPVLWLGLTVLTALLGSHRLPRAWRGMAKPLPGKDHLSSALAAPTGRGGSGTEGGPAGSSHARSWLPGRSLAGVALPTLLAFLPGPACGPWRPTGLGANASCAPNWLCDPWLPSLCLSFHFQDLPVRTPTQ